MKHKARSSTSRAQVILVAASLVFVNCSDTLEPEREPRPSAGFVEVSVPGGTEIGTLGGSASEALGLNDNGYVVGSSTDQTSRWRPFGWTPSTGVQDILTTPPPLDSVSARAADVNNAGTIVGDTGVSFPRGFRKQGASTQILEPLPGGSFSQAVAVNENGLAAGSAHDSNDLQRAVVWDLAGTITSLGTLGGDFSNAEDVNDLGTVVGISNNANFENRAFKWSADSGMIALPAPHGGTTGATSVNNAGRIVGFMTVASGEVHAVIWELDGSITDLGTLGGNQSVAWDINELGYVVGESRDASGVMQAFVWDVVGGMQPIGGIKAVAINENGLIVGNTAINGFPRAVYWQLPPPPNLSLSCTPAIVQRATLSTRCVPSAAPGATLQVTGWRFVGGPNNEFEVAPPGAVPSTWEGPMVVSGAVWVYGNVNGVPDSATATIEVTPRPWPNPPMDDPAPELPQSQATDMPLVPTVDHHLGHAHQQPVLDDNYPNGPFIKAIQGGPNFLLFYNDAPPVTRIKAWTEINRDALTNSTNPWYQSHPRNRQNDPQGRPICRQQDLRSTILGIVVSHEANHIAFGRNWWAANNLNALAEAVVSNAGSQAVANATFDTVDAAAAAEQSANVAAVDPVAFPCVFLF